MFGSGEVRLQGNDLQRSALLCWGKRGDLFRVDGRIASLAEWTKEGLVGFGWRLKGKSMPRAALSRGQQA